MKDKYPFNSAEFLLSADCYANFPKLQHDEIAIVGRSNVGKSSLINHLFHKKNLAKVSSRPGKTQLLNLFLVDKSLLFVDLPGYGYAKVPKAMKTEWSKTIDEYLNISQQLKLVLFLVDSRHLPTNEDLQFFNWLNHSQVPFITILTKCDKLKKHEVKTQADKIRKELCTKKTQSDYPYICYSIQQGESRRNLIREINKSLLCDQ